jgi:hypothetical protein
MRLRNILLGAAALIVSFVTAFAVANWFSPQPTTAVAPEVVQLPPLKPFAPKSTIVTPVAISLTAIRDTLDHAAPRNLAGKAANPVQQLLSNADINWTVARGPLTASGAPNTLSINTPLTGKLSVLGQLSSGAANVVGGAIGSILGDAAKRVGTTSLQSINASADIRGNVAITARPALTANWRLVPNLSGAATLSDTAVNISAIRIPVQAQVKPLLDNNVNEQLGHLEQRLRNDPTLEQTARREWAKMCRSIALPASNGLPPLWLEIRPVRAVAAQPRIDARAVTLSVGIDAESRISGAETKPTCPFPATLALVPQVDEGRLAIGIPIDMPFTDVSKLVGAQLNGKTFPEDNSAPVAITIKSATVAPAGKKLLISLVIRATEKQSFLGLGGDATINVTGVPQLDQATQLLRLTEIDLTVDSAAAFGLMGTAARAALPRLKKVLEERAVIDLKPFAQTALTRIGAALADFRSPTEGTRVDAAVTSLKLIDIDYDNKTLRIVTEANGTVAVAVNQLPAL